MSAASGDVSGGPDDSMVGVLLVGHCTPDSSHLTMAVRRAAPKAVVRRAEDDADVLRAIESGDLLLINRAMEPGFSHADGNELIKSLKSRHPNARLMLISNYESSQAQAIADGAQPGFGKSSLMKPETTDLIRRAMSI